MESDLHESCDVSYDSVLNSTFDSIHSDLSRENQRLNRENANLRAQILEFSCVSEKLDEMSASNSSLQRDVRRLSAERDDYRHRVEICLQTIEDLKKQNNELSQSAKSSQQHEMDTFVTKLEAERSDTSRKISEIVNQSVDTGNKLRLTELRLKDSEDQVLRLLSVFNSKFNVDLKAVDDIIAFVSHYKIPQEPKCEEAPRVDETELQHAYYLIDMKQQKLRKSRNHTRLLQKEHEKEIQMLMQSSEAKINSLEEIVSCLKHQVAESDHQTKLISIEKEHTISSLRRQIDDMRLSASSQVHILTQQSPPPSPEPPSQKVDYDRVSLNYSELRRKYDRLKQIYQKVKKANEHFSEEVKEYKYEKERLNSLNEELRLSVANVETDNQRMKAEIESLSKKLNGTLVDLQKAENDLKNEKFKRNQLNTALENSLTFSSSLKNQITDLYQQRSRLSELVNKLSQLLSQTLEEPDIPFNSWFCPSFPPELTTLVKLTVVDPSMSNRSKLERVLEIVTVFYQNQISKWRTTFM